jgi:hypothetical protein
MKQGQSRAPKEECTISEKTIATSAHSLSGFVQLMANRSTYTLKISSREQQKKDVQAHQ